METSRVDLKLNNKKKANGVARLPNLSITRASFDEMHVAAEIVSSTAEWYRPIVDAKDMAEHSVDKAWAQKNYAIREFFFGRELDETVGIVSMQHAGDYVYVGYVYLMAHAVGRGHGRALLDFVRGKAAARGYRGMVLIAHPDATWAVKAYEKFGFSVTQTAKEDVLAWNAGFLRPYHEEGFVLFQLDF